MLCQKDGWGYIILFGRKNETMPGGKKKKNNK